MDKCPDCGSPLIADHSPLVFRTFDCGCVWKDLSTPVREMGQTMTCKDRTIASLTAEVERLKHTMAATRSRFQKLSEDPNVSAVVQQAYACVLFAIDYPDKIVADYLKEPEHVRPD